jgi:hypothetical protein
MGSERLHRSRQLINPNKAFFLCRKRLHYQIDDVGRDAFRAPVTHIAEVQIHHERTAGFLAEDTKFPFAAVASHHSYPTLGILWQMLRAVVVCDDSPELIGLAIFHYANPRKRPRN